MQTIKEEKIKEQKQDNYMSNDLPNVNKTYQLIKKIESNILNMVAFSIPDVDSRIHMDTIRDSLRGVACRDCQHLNQLTLSEKTVNVLVKDDDLSEEYGVLIETEREPIKVVKVLTERRVNTVNMSCIGCRALRLKQIATGYIKGRRFKQV